MDDIWQVALVLLQEPDEVDKSFGSLERSNNFSSSFLGEKWLWKPVQYQVWHLNDVERSKH